MNNEPILRRDDRGPVTILTLNRPEARNSLSLEMIGALQGAVQDLGGNDAVRAIVVTGAGTAFSSGHDLKELTAHRNDPDRGRDFFAKTMNACSDMMLAIVRCPKPVIAGVNGIATAAGCQLVASCDLAVAAGDARFATPGVNIGLFCSTPMVALSRNISRKAAMEMLLFGELVSAQDAQALGLVNRVVANDRVVNEAVEFGRRIAEKPKRTLKIGKEAFYRQLDLSLEDAYHYASAVMVENMLDDEAKEGIGAFIDKRPPRWPE
ncbi:MAG: enoyl-CoA hydratase [Alphaproteobacteria bacterium]|nr:enoyl-CoA hydratase [Alphaproteobacteria bacterium]